MRLSEFSTADSIVSQLIYGVVLFCGFGFIVTKSLDGYVKESRLEKANQQMALNLASKPQNGSTQKMALNANISKGQTVPRYDYLPVASIPEQAAKNVILDPCLGRPQ